MNNTTQANSHWWGELNLSDAQNHQWQIGPLTLLVRCQSGEWQLAFEGGPEFLQNGSDWSIGKTAQTPDQMEAFSRYVFRETSGLLTLTPLLADRAIVSRPITPFNLTAG